MPQIKIIEKDPTISGKILFFYVFANQEGTTEELTEKIEFMTMEAREKMFEQIFNSDPINLPELALNLPFITLQISDTHANLQALQKQKNIKIILQKTKNVFSENSAEQNNSSTKNLDVSFQTSAIMTINLNSIISLKKHQTPLSQPILDLIRAEFSFLAPLF